jgi:predicted ATPase
MEPIKIIRVIPEKVELFSPDGTSIGILDNDHELNKIQIQIQIAKESLTGYYIIWQDIKIPITAKGELTQWPKGMYNQSQRDFSELFNIRKSK